MKNKVIFFLYSLMIVLSLILIVFGFRVKAADTSVSSTAMLLTTFTNSTTTPVNMPNLNFSANPNTKYMMDCILYYQGSAASAGLDITLTGPANPSSIFYSFIEDATQTGGSQDSVANSFGTKLTGAGTIVATTNLPVTISMGLLNGPNYGLIQVQGSSTGAGTVTVQPGSWCRLQQVF